jgi:hypothetical protein
MKLVSINGPTGQGIQGFRIEIAAAAAVGTEMGEGRVRLFQQYVTR